MIKCSFHFILYILKSFAVFSISMLFTVKLALAANETKEFSKVKKNSEVQAYSVQKIYQLDWNGPITPATYKYFKGAIDISNGDKTILLIKLSTPGWLVSTTKDILTLFGESSVPIIVWITPEEASATSSGAIISAGAHILVMSSGTNIGAATPVQLNSDIDSGQKAKTSENQSDLRIKAINDLVALVRSLAHTRGRNADMFEKMISEAASYESETALKEGLIDSIVNSRSDLEKLLNDRVITVKGERIQLVTNSPEWIEVSMSLGDKWLKVLSHPNLAYILFLIGIALIYFELQSPGGFIAGSIGVIALIFSGIGFQALPINIGAVGLILLAVILFVLEIFVTSFGILSTAGLVSLVTGSLFLFNTDDAYLSLSKSIILSAATALAVFFVIVGLVIVKDRRKKRTAQFNTHNNQLGHIVKQFEFDQRYYWYQVKVSGEIWKARSTKVYNIGDRVKIYERDTKGLFLVIQD